MSRSTEENTLHLTTFTGGLNNVDHPSSIDDSECTALLNFEVQLDGTLRTRPPIRAITAPDQPDLEIIGIVTNPFNGQWYLLANSANGSTYHNLYGNTTWTTLVARRMLSCVQYGGKVYFTCLSGNGGYWDFTTWTDDATIPAGHKILAHKSRLWVVPGVNSPASNTSRLQFSDPVVTTPVWTATNIIDVFPGDGTNLVDAVVYNDDLMLFKEDATYVYAFDLLPEDGLIREVNNSIGASNKHCVVEYQNSLFVYHESNVYEVQNYNFIKVNEKVRFDDTASQDAMGSRYYFCHLSILDDRLIVRNFNAIYAYSLTTRTWSQWDSDSFTLETFGPWWKVPKDSTDSTPNEYVTSNQNTSITDADLYYFQFPVIDAYAATSHEDFIAVYTSKYFDFDDPVHYKRMKWTAADVCYPYQLTFITFREGNIDSGEMLVPTAGSFDGTADATDQRRTVKAGGSFRFKTCYFRITIRKPVARPQEDGWVYGVTAVVNKKQTISSQVTT